MNYKLEGAINKNKKYITLFVILWVAMQVILIAPCVYLGNSMQQNDSMGMINAIEEFPKMCSNPFLTISLIVKGKLFGKYLSAIVISSAIYLMAIIIGCIKAAPKNEYSDIEHGSSDWSQKGEQYQILDKNDGILLAEKNYLPVTKRGNINVLVVGRIWIW